MGPHVLASGSPQKRSVAHPLHRRQVDDVMTRVPGGAAVSVSGTSTLVLDGKVTLHSLQLDGALVVRAGPGVSVEVKDCKIANAGWAWRPLAEGEGQPEAIAIRGYTVDKKEAVVHEITEPGAYEISGAGELKKLKDEL